MKRSLQLLALTALGIVAAGCNSGPVVPDGYEVVVRQGHGHSRYCGHYQFRSSWYYVPLHRHGPNCPHVPKGNIWVLEEE